MANKGTVSTFDMRAVSEIIITANMLKRCIDENAATIDSSCSAVEEGLQGGQADDFINGFKQIKSAYVEIKKSMTNIVNVLDEKLGYAETLRKSQSAADAASNVASAAKKAGALKKE